MNKMIIYFPFAAESLKLLKDQKDGNEGFLLISGFGGVCLFVGGRQVGELATKISFTSTASMWCFCVLVFSLLVICHNGVSMSTVSIPQVLICYLSIGESKFQPQLTSNWVF